MLKFIGRRLASGALFAAGFFAAIGVAWALDSLSRNITATSIDQPSLVTFLGNVVTKVNALDATIDSLVTLGGDSKTLVNSVRNTLAGDSLLNDVTCSVGSDADEVATTAFYFLVNGGLFLKAAITDGTELAGSGDTIPQNKWGGFAFDIGADGTIDAVKAADNDDPGYDSSALALAALPAVAADHVRLCTLTVVKTDAEFTVGTTALSDGATTDTFANSTTALAAVGAAVSSSPTAVSDTDDLTLSRP